MISIWESFLNLVLPKSHFVYNSAYRGGEGKDQIGTLVNIEGRKGKVIDGTALFITVRWNWYW